MSGRRFLYPSVKDSFEIAHDLFISVTDVQRSPITRTFRDCDHELLQKCNESSQCYVKGFTFVEPLFNTRVNRCQPLTHPKPNTRIYFWLTHPHVNRGNSHDLLQNTTENNKKRIV